jgi:hypothetical protein
MGNQPIRLCLRPLLKNPKPNNRSLVARSPNLTTRRCGSKTKGHFRAGER